MDEVMKVLKQEIFKKDLKMWQVANQIGITQYTLSIWMRKYNKEHFNKISKAIDELTGGDHNG